MISKMGENVKVHDTAKTYGENEVGANSIIMDNVYLGYPDTKTLLRVGKHHLDFSHAKYKGCTLGQTNIIREGCVFYCDVETGDFVRTGHKVLVREGCRIGSNVLIGSNTVIENNCDIGSHVSIQSSVFIPTNTFIADYVFIGPNVCMTNDKYPVRIKEEVYRGPIIQRGVSLGAGCVILPLRTIGEGCIVASNSTVTKDVPPWQLVRGSPATWTPLPDKLRKLNEII